MKNIAYLIIALVLTSCNTTVDVLSVWKSKDVNELKGRNILVIARTADPVIRADFETSIANKFRAAGYKATESFTRFPKLDPDKEMTEERQKLIRDIFGYEGYDAVCISVLKDYEETTTTTYYNDYMGMGMMGPYSSFYPGYYGGFNSYYMHPYSYSTFGNYYGSGSSYTSTDKMYVLETLVYNLEREDGDQLLIAATTKITNPKDAIKAADKYTEKIAESLARLE
ncbi:MAG: hypothetical protein L3J09_01230 [Flavobacteriaceae bacterium]|nr:hypothetical protein [Flavobacteriaceae bacterium]